MLVNVNELGIVKGDEMSLFATDVMEAVLPKTVRDTTLVYFSSNRGVDRTRGGRSSHVVGKFVWDNPDKIKNNLKKVEQELEGSDSKWKEHVLTTVKTAKLWQSEAKRTEYLNFSEYTDNKSKNLVDFYARFAGQLTAQLVSKFDTKRKFSDFHNDNQRKWVGSNLNPILEPLGLEVSKDRFSFDVMSTPQGETFTNIIQQGCSNWSSVLQEENRKETTPEAKVSFSCATEECKYKSSDVKANWVALKKPIPSCLYGHGKMTESSKFGGKKAEPVAKATPVKPDLIAKAKPATKRVAKATGTKKATTYKAVA